MVSFLSDFISHFTSDDDEMSIEDMSLEELKEERSDLKAELELKRDKHRGLAEKRREKFEKLRSTDDDLMKEELAEEIASIEDEMSIYHNEHAQIMEALSVVDGLIAVKKKEKLMEDQDLVQELEEMDTGEIVDLLKQKRVQELIQEEKWGDLKDIVRGELEPEFSGSKRVREILETANNTEDKQVDEALKMRDEERLN